MSGRISLLVLVATLLQPSSTVVSPVAFWPFNSTYGYNDHKGAFTTTPTEVSLTEGPCGGPDTALLFTKSKKSHLRVTMNDKLNSPKSFSFTLMLKPTTGNVPIFRFDIPNDPRATKLWLFPKNLVFFGIKSIPVKFKHMNETAVPVALNTWSFLGVSYNADAGVVVVVTDDARKLMTTDKNLMSHTPGDLLIGEEKGISQKGKEYSAHFDGAMSSLRYFDTALTAEEMTSFKIRCPPREMPDPIAFWPLNSTFGRKDYENAFNTKVVGQVTLAGGPCGQDTAYAFDRASESHLRVAKSNALNLQGSFSVVAMVNPSSGDPMPVVEYLLSDVLWGMHVWIIQNRLFLNHGKVIRSRPTVAVTEKIWSLVGVSYDSETGLATFVSNNSTEVIPTSNYTTLDINKVSSGDLLIGARLLSTKYFFDGRMSHVRMYNVCLTADEMRALAPVCPVKEIPDPIAFWPLNSTSGYNDHKEAFNTIAFGHVTLARSPCGPESSYRFVRASSSYLRARSSSLHLKGSFSVVAMVSPSSLGSTGGNMPVIEYMLAKGLGLHVWLAGTNDQKIYLYFKPEKVKRSGDAVVSKNSWALIGVSYDYYTGLVTFVSNNRTRVVQMTKKLDIDQFTSEDLLIGGRIAAKKEKFFDGWMSHVRIYNVCLTAEEMKSLAPVCPVEVTTTTTTSTAATTATTTTVATSTTTTTTTTTTVATTTTTPRIFNHRATLHEGYTRSPTPCRSEDWAYSNQTGMCYMFFSDKVSQAEAVDVCRDKDNSDLLSIQNQDEQDFIDKVLNYDYLDQWTLGKKAGVDAADRALNKPAWQSSTHGDGHAVKAVDGNFEDRYFEQSCTHTLLDDNAWWAVDLGNVYSVTWINLQNRGDCCAGRLSNFDVVVSNTKPPTSGSLPDLAKLVSEGLCVTQTNALPMGKTSLKCTTPKDGRYVYVILKGKGFLTICEAEVFGVEKNQDFTYAGEKIRYGNWLSDELLTKTTQGEAACISLVKNIFTKGFFMMKWKWDTKPCTEKKSFVCQHRAKRCPALPTAQFVEPHPTKPYIELTIDYKCSPGYQMPNYELRYQQWQAKKPPSNDTALTKAWLEAKPNITKKPSMTYTCESPGKWSDGSLAPCEAKSCPSPPEVKHAERNSSARVYPAWIEYKCEHGYHYAYDNTSAKVGWCSPDLEWIDVPEDCEPVECELFPRVGNATLNSAENRFKETVVWTCNPGFMFPDRTVSKWISCRENFVNWQIGRWNISKLDDCIPLACPDPPKPTNTTVSSNGTDYGTVIFYSCVNEEYEFPSGDEEMRTECVDGAVWRPMPSPCKKKPKKLKLKGKFYVPPPKESPSAKTVGTLAMIIMIILMVLMVLMDLGTMWQGVRFLRYNLRSRFCHKKKH